MISFPRPSRALQAAAAAVILASCGTVDDIRQTTQDRGARASLLTDRAILAQPQSRRPALLLKDEYWLGGSSRLMTRGVPLPRGLDAPGGFTYLRADPVSLQEIADDVRRMTGIPLRLDSDVRSIGQPVRIEYAGGTLTGFLDSLSSIFEVDWDYDGGEIRLYRFDTRSWVLEALPGQIRMASGISSGVEGGSSSSSASGGGAANTTITNSQRTSIEAAVDIWNDLETTIRAQLPQGATLAVLPSAGTVTVRGRRQTLDQVDSQIRALNKRLGRQIIVAFKVYSVVLENGADYGVDLQAVINDLAGDWRISLGSPAAGRVLGAGSFTAALLDPSSRFGGSEAFLEALERNNNVAIVTQQGIMAMNGVPTPVNVVRQTAYIDSVSQSITGSDVVVSGVTQGTVTTGFTLTLLPSIVDDQTVILRYNLALSDLRNLNTIETGNIALQTPEVDQRASSQQIKLRDEQTLILAGFDQTQDSILESGVGRPDNLWLGGRQRAQRQRTLLVVTLTPYIQDAAPVRVRHASTGAQDSSQAGERPGMALPGATPPGATPPAGPLTGPATSGPFADPAARAAP